MTLQDKFVLLVQTECLTEVFSGDMAQRECSKLMADVFSVWECDIEEALPEKRLHELAMDYISWKLHESIQPSWIKTHP
jgi:hypothetical protein